MENIQEFHSNKHHAYFLSAEIAAVSTELEMIYDYPPWKPTVLIDSLSTAEVL